MRCCPGGVLRPPAPSRGYVHRRSAVRWTRPAAMRHLQLDQLAFLSDFEADLVAPVEHLLAQVREHQPFRTYLVKMLTQYVVSDVMGRRAVECITLHDEQVGIARHSQQ